MPSDDLLADVAPLFPNGNIAESKEEDLAETVLPVAWDSAELVDEPEFAEIEISPLVAVQTYVNIIQEQGHLEAEDAAELDDDEREETIAEALDEAVYRLLTPELRQQLIAGLTALRLRFHRDHQHNEVPRVAAVQLFLEIDQDGRIAATLGLVQELVRRGIGAGFEIAQRLRELPEEATEDEATAPEA